MSTKPDYVLKALDKETDDKSKVGAAWLNKDGTISIVLDSFVVLEGKKKLLLTLFPKEL